MAHFPSPPTTNKANQSPLQFYIKFIYVHLFLLFFFILLTPSIFSLSLSSLFLLPLHYYNMSSVSREINGSRPAPLKIHKDSHLIHKASSSSSSSSSTSTSTTTTTTTSSHQQQRHHPVIIYTHSPKVIHTQARDFMALVQKLTGLSRSAADDDSSSPSLLRPHNRRPHANTRTITGLPNLLPMTLPLHRRIAAASGATCMSAVRRWLLSVPYLRSPWSSSRR
ncbi:unnamed protein product [Musa acuminata subsp. burmannicoides]